MLKLISTYSGCCDFFSENFLKLKVYYGELNFEVIEEELAYKVEKINFSCFRISRGKASLQRRKTQTESNAVITLHFDMLNLHDLKFDNLVEKTIAT